MKHSDMVIGRRYMLPHGSGVLLGHETFLPSGFAGPMSPTVHPYQSTRHVFMLDEGHNWAHGDYPYSSEPVKYCAWDRDIVEIPQ